MTIPFRWISPPGGPAKTSADLAKWAADELLSVAGQILANARDLPALRGTMLAERCMLPDTGVVQPGTLWLMPEAAS